MTEETWRPIPGWQDLYEASSLGAVRRAAGGVQGATAGRVLKQRAHNGYLWVGLHRGGNRRTCSVHRLVAAAFHGPATDGQVARHLDGDGQNNAASNLRWGTQAENEADKPEHFSMNRSVTHCPRGHAYDEENTYRNNGRRHCRACNRRKKRQRKEAP